MILKRTAVIFAAAVMLASQTCPADEIVMEDGAYEIREDISGDTGYTPEETQDDFARLIEDDETDPVTETEDAFRPEVPGNAQACPDDGHDWTEWEQFGEGRNLDARSRCTVCGKERTASQIAASFAYTPASCLVQEMKVFFDENGQEIVALSGEESSGHVPGEYVQETPGGPYVQRCVNCGEILASKSYATSVRIPPTCTEPGYIVTETDGTVKRTETDSPLGHEWIRTVSVNDDFGSVHVSQICTRCNIAEETDYDIVSKDFDCVDGGTVTYRDENGEEKTIDAPGYEDHDWGEWIDVTGDREFGSFHERTCRRCGKKEEKGMGSAVASEIIPPTCTEPGREIIYTHNNSGEQVIIKEKVTDDALGHDFSVVKQTLPPDDCAVSGGKTTYKCSRCEETVTVTLPPSEHDWTEWTGTATKTRECRKCHKQETTEDSSSGSRDPAPSNTDGQSTASSGTGANPSAGSVKPASGAVSKPAAPAKKQPVTITAKGLKDGKLALKKGKSRKLKAVLSGVKGKVKWSSSKKKVVSVDKKGKIKAKKKGTAYITAKVGKHKVKIKVVVR